MSWYVDRMSREFEKKYRCWPGEEHLARWSREESWITFFRIGSAIVGVGALCMFAFALAQHWSWVCPGLAFAFVSVWSWRIPRSKGWGVQ